MLFEDKGCTFIAVFDSATDAALAAVMAALQMVEWLRMLGVARPRLGVSMGELFCGVCGPRS